MSPAESQFDPLFELAACYCDGSLSAVETVSLEERLRDDPHAMDSFVLYMEMHSQLAWDLRAKGEQERTRSGQNEAIAQVGPNEAIGEICLEGGSLRGPSPLPPVVVQTLPPTASALPSFVGSTLFSYLAAAVIFGVGLIVGSLIRVAVPTELMQPPLAQFDSNAPGRAVIGRITAMDDCRWSDGARDRGAKIGDATSCADDSSFAVHLGDTLALRSGLLEITYDTGATVILQGPVTYRADMQNGGFLAQGRLTGCVETVAARGFAIRTPTAVVTDLGTEFGVETDGKKTWSCVFRGAIEVAGLASDGRKRSTVRLKNRESAVVETSGAVSMNAEVGDRRFVRSVPRRSGIASNDFGGQVVLRETFDRNGPIGANGYAGLAIGTLPLSSGALQSQYAAVFGGRLLLSRELEGQSDDYAETTETFAGPALVAVDIGRDSTSSLRFWHVAMRLGALEIAFHPGLRMDDGSRGVFRAEVKREAIVPNSDMGFIPGVDVMHHMLVYFDGNDQYDVRLQDGSNPRNVYRTHFVCSENAGKRFSVSVHRAGYAGTGMFDNLRVVQWPDNDSPPESLRNIMKGPKAMN